MADHSGPRWAPERVAKADATDRITHPMTSDDTIAYFFTLGGVTAQNKALHCALGSHERHQVPLCCRLCNTGLGSYIYSSTSNRGLSDNQQRKNRNIMLFGKAHLKSHGLFPLQLVPLTRVGVPNVAPVEEISQPMPDSALPSCSSGPVLGLSTSIVLR